MPDSEDAIGAFIRERGVTRLPTLIGQDRAVDLWLAGIRGRGKSKAANNRHWERRNQKRDAERARRAQEVPHGR